MEYRELGRTGWRVSSISFGAWAIGGTWGSVDDDESMQALRKAVEMGVNFFDTADVYGDGRSERLIADLREDFPGELHISTKAGRRLDPHVVEGYTGKNLNAFVNRSLKNLRMESLDLLQLHCPPTEAYYMPELFQTLDDMISAGKIKHYGVSVERVEEALKAIEYPNVQTIQIIFNMFRLRPSELFFKEAINRQVGILARVPLASGLLTGKMSSTSTFEDDDHRKFNRQGEAFDKGETFSGVPYDVGLAAMEKIKQLCPQGQSMGQFALRWILMHDAVTCAIPGAKRVDQTIQNVESADLPPLSADIMQEIGKIYHEMIAPHVHQLW